MSKLQFALECQALALVLLFWLQVVVAQGGLADSVSPSTRTRTLLTPKDNYYQEITNGQPYRWFDRDMALTVLIKAGAGLPQFKPRFEEILREAFQDWENISNSKIHFRFVSEQPADITCQFVEDMPDQQAGVAGFTSYQTSPYHVESTVIALKTYSSLPLKKPGQSRGSCFLASSS